MYWYIEDMETMLKCPICTKPFEQPKLLPCGNRICEECEKLMQPLTTQSKQVKCSVCKEKHMKPTGGFPTDTYIKKLLTIKPVTVYRGEVHKKAQNTINELNVSLEELKDNIKNSQSRLKTFCDKLRNEIDGFTDRKIALFEKYRRQLLTDINDYEKTCLENVQDTNEKFKQLDRNYEDFNLKYHEWQEFVKRPDITDSELLEMIEAAELFINKVKENLLDLDEHLFDNKKVSFMDTNKQVDLDEFGKLVKLPIKEETELSISNSKSELKLQ